MRNAQNPRLGALMPPEVNDDCDELPRSWEELLGDNESSFPALSKIFKIQTKYEILVHFRATSNFKIGKSADLSTYFPNMAILCFYCVMNRFSVCFHVLLTNESMKDHQ